MQNNALYLPEDQDLLDVLDKMGPMSTSQALAEQERKLSVAQTKATLRHRKTAADASRSTDIYSRALILFAGIQVIIAAAQYLIEGVNSPNHQALIAVAGVIIVAVLVFSGWIIKTVGDALGL